jgi:hypothetical protein
LFLQTPRPKHCFLEALEGRKEGGSSTPHDYSVMLIRQFDSVFVDLLHGFVPLLSLSHRLLGFHLRMVYARGQGKRDGEHDEEEQDREQIVDVQEVDLHREGPQ